MSSSHRAGCAGAALLVASACTTLPQPTPADVARIQATHPQITLEVLTQGRKEYVSKCSSCHALHQPTEFAAGRWPSLLDEMEREQRVKLTRVERNRIEDYLVALAR